MLIYEKDNKLNINFENNVEETPDLQISKESGKTEVKIDGQQGGSGGANVLTLYVGYDESTGNSIAYKDSALTQTYETYEEAANAVTNADIIKAIWDDTPGQIYFGLTVSCSLVEQVVFVTFNPDNAYLFGGPPESLGPIDPIEPGEPVPSN